MNYCTFMPSQLDSFVSIYISILLHFFTVSSSTTGIILGCSLASRSLLLCDDANGSDS